MMRAFSSLLVCFLLLMGLAGCGGNSSGSSQSTPPAATRQFHCVFKFD